MKKFHGQSFLAGVIVCALCLSATAVWAEPVQKSIEVIFGQVKLVVDGKPVEHETLLYNGTTYVPLRAAAELFGKKVGWDGATNTAYLGVVPEQTAPAPAPADQATLEKEYMQFMVGVYYDLQAAMEAMLEKIAETEENPELVLDASWIAEFKMALGEFTGKMSAIEGYDTAKVPESLAAFHSTYLTGCKKYEKGAVTFIYGLENLDEDALDDALAMLVDAVADFERAAELQPGF